MDAWARLRARFGPHLLPGDERVEPGAVYARAALLFGLALWTPAFVFADIREGGAMNLWMHGVYLVFHEAGHVLFSPLGRFLTVAGGTIMQLAMPAAVVVSFLRRSDPFGAAVGLWWLGGSLLDCAPYIYDARLGDLPLLGGFLGAERPEFHDWTNLLRWTGLILHDTKIARATQALGALAMLAGLAWGLAILRVQHRHRGPR